MRYIGAIILTLSIALALGVSASAMLFTWRDVTGNPALRVMSYTPYIHSGRLIAQTDGTLTISGALPGLEQNVAPLLMRYGKNTKFIKHSPLAEDGVWVGMDAQSLNPRALKEGDYLYVSFIYDLDGRHLATEVIVANPLIQ